MANSRTHTSQYPTISTSSGSQNADHFILSVVKTAIPHFLAPEAISHKMTSLKYMQKYDLFSGPAGRDPAHGIGHRGARWAPLPVLIAFPCS